MNKKFRGWRSVFAFTFQQTTKAMSFRIITFIVAFLIFGGLILTNVLMAKPDKEDKLEPSPIKSVYVLDNSGLQAANYKAFISQLNEKQFDHIEFNNIEDKSEEEVTKLAKSNSSQSIAVVISTKGSDYEMKAIIPDQSDIEKDAAEDFLEIMSSAFQSNKLMQVGLSEEQLVSALKASVVSFSNVGESSNPTIHIVKVFVPMIFSFILYIMLLLYSQNICRSVSTEKTSKLMDTLLTSVHPYALITGKVLANVTIALGQFALWIASAIIGLFAGNAIAQEIYPGFENIAITMLNFLRNNIGESALTAPAIVMAIFILCLGFLFYCVIAALAGSTVSKPEEAANSQGVFNLIIVFSWIVSYIAPSTDNKTLITALRYIPFTIPFSVPVDLVIGNIGLLQGVLSIATLSVFSVLVIILSARIYKGLVLYTGQKFNLKLIANILNSK
ncbi:MAG TPA: ABC transporter permease [Clostridium sp.]|jgi:ABC-type Na+ efflux pump permease subunit|nr:ABC transporter permease [Clostridium sp.]